MDTCGKLYKTCVKKGLDIKVIGIPKTMDNDIAITDHSPGFGSAARFIAQSVKEVCADVKGLPIHVVVVEASGRNAGWITAASSLTADEDGLGPDLIYLPERPFDEDKYIEDIEKLLKKKSGIVVVASEGLKDKNGNPVVEPIFKIGRASMTLQSSVDREEAELAGKIACEAVMHGESGKMVAFERICSEVYEVRTFLIEIDKVMMYEKTMPDDFINEDGNGVTEIFKDWCRPLIGGKLPSMISFNLSF